MEKLTRDTCDSFDGGSFREKKTGKGAYDRISAIGLKRLAQRYEYGPLVYHLPSPLGMREGFPWSNLYSSALRHINEWRLGDNSEDHLAAAAWNLFELMHSEVAGDRKWNDIKERQGKRVDRYTKVWPYVPKKVEE